MECEALTFQQFGDNVDMCSRLYDKISL